MINTTKHMLILLLTFSLLAYEDCSAQEYSGDFVLRCFAPHSCPETGITSATNGSFRAT